MATLAQLLSKSRLFLTLSAFLGLAAAPLAPPRLDHRDDLSVQAESLDDFGISYLESAPPYDDGTHAPDLAPDPGFGWRINHDLREE